ncbi:MAG: AmmeMemoRadiSam system protein B [Acidobacteriota bacterium]
MFAASAAAQAGRDVRIPAVAGQFYPSDPKALRQAITQFLEEAVSVQVRGAVGLIVPHAGYAYSGQICADGYRQVRGLSPDVVVLLGTNHTTGGFGGVSLYDRGAFRTPLGDAQVEESLASALLAEGKGWNADRSVHLREHSVEVQVPFIQVVFPRARILPMVVGAGDPGHLGRLGEALARALRGRRALIVASSDLSHYPAYADANRVDRETLVAMAALDPAGFGSAVERIMRRNIPNLDTCACGEAPIMVALAAAKAMGAREARVVSYANSGDALIGDKGRVVGYGAAVLCSGSQSPAVREGPATDSGAPLLGLRDKKALLVFARTSLERYLTSQTIPLARGLSARLQVPQGAFVTIKKQGQLRGCIGHMASDTPLGQTVGAMTLQAALHDPRFRPLQHSEFPEVEIEISVLTPYRQIASASEIQVGRDGVILIKGGRSAVFLPQVAVENGWDYPELLDNLCLKAGLPAGSWKEGARLLVFQADVFSEEELR